PQAELSVSGLPRGLYLLKVETVGGTAVRKVVVE
ncbi:MAG: T9SS type A sorting domain-containing protein, partial [Bacteroidales bacterium]|nr:T9SS type A sorting domain-containing protein [Bacteroidales bacterium]